MSETISFARRHQHETRNDAREECAGAAPVGAVVGRDESPGPRIRAGREESALSALLEIPRQEDRGPDGGPRAQDQAAIVERTAAVLDAWVEDRQLEACADGAVASLQSSNRHAAGNRVGRHDAGHWVARRSFADPQLADVEIAQHRKRSTRMIVVIVRQGENLEATAASRRKRGNDDAVAGVEPSAPRGTCIHEDEATVRATQDDREPLPDVDDLGSCRSPSGRRWTQVQGNRAKSEEKSDRASTVPAPIAVPEACGKEQDDVGRDQRRRGRGHAQMPPGNGGRAAGGEEEC